MQKMLSKQKKIFESNEYFKKNRIDESKEFLIVDTQIAFDSASPTTFKHVVKKIAISENYDFIQESNRKTVDLTDLTHLGLHRLVALSTAEEAEFGYLEKISF